MYATRRQALNTDVVRWRTRYRARLRCPIDAISAHTLIVIQYKHEPHYLGDTSGVIIAYSLQISRDCVTIGRQCMRG
jgi:hypothetical protein